MLSEWNDKWAMWLFGMMGMPRGFEQQQQSAMS